MSHFYIMINFIGLCIGLFTLGILTLLYLKNRDSLLRYLLVFLAVFTLLIIITIVGEYNSANIQNNKFSVIFILQNICPYAVIFTGILIFHEIFDVKYNKIINSAFLIVLSLSFLFEMIEDLLIVNNIGSLVTNYFDEAVFSATIIYLLSLILFYRKRIKKTEIKRFSRLLIIAVLVTLFLFIMDSLEKIIKTDIPLGSIIYMTWSVFILILIFKYYSNIILNKVEVNDYFIRKYKISQREAEIINQLLKGHSYKKISGDNFISLSTVKSHVSNIYKKIDIKSRHELFTIVRENSD